MATKQEKWQEIANRGLQDNFDPETRAKFDEAVRRGLITLPQQQPQFQSESEIPIENEMDLPFAPKQQQPDATLADKAIGVGETALSVGTAATGGTFGYISGVLNQLAQEVAGGNFGSMEAADRIQKAATDMASQNTYSPRSDKGQEYTGVVGQAAEMLTPIAPQLAEFQMLKPKLPRVKAPTKNELMTRKLMDGSTDTDTAKFMLQNKDGTQMAPSTLEQWRDPNIAKSQRPFALLENAQSVKSPAGNSLISHGFDKALIPVMREASPKSVSRFRQMTKTAEGMTKNLKAKTLTSPLDHVGEALFERFDFFHKKNKVAGRAVRKAASDLKGIQLSDDELGIMSDNFKGRLEELGATINDKGGFGVSYAEGSPMTSPFLKKARSSIDKLVTTLSMDKKRPDAFRLHQLKKTLDEVVNWDKRKADPSVVGQVEALVKATRADINELLRDKSPAYKEANLTAHKTFDMMDEMRKILKETNDLNDPRIVEKIGLQMRKLNSNYGSKNSILNLIQESDRLAKELGGVFKDDIVDLAIYGSQLGKRFKLDGDNTFKALTTQAELDAFTKGGMIRKGYEGAKGVWKNDEKAFEAAYKYLDELEANKKK